MVSRSNLRSFGVGFGAALLLGSLWPTIKEGARPGMKAALKGLVATSDKVRAVSSQLQAEVEDMVAEAQYEHSTDHETEREGIYDHTTRVGNDHL